MRKTNLNTNGSEKMNRMVWFVELNTDDVLYVAYFDTEAEARRDASRVFQLYSMPAVFRAPLYN